MEIPRLGRINATTWIVLGLCAVVGVAAVSMTAIVILRLNRQVLASAAQLRGNLAQADTTLRDDALVYAIQQATIEESWNAQIADYRLRYPNNPVFETVVTASTVATIANLRPPTDVTAIHQRWAQGWSDREAALGLLTSGSPTDVDRARAAELARRANDLIRDARNDLRTLLLARGLREEDLAIARLGRT